MPEERMDRRPETDTLEMLESLEKFRRAAEQGLGFNETKRLVVLAARASSTENKLVTILISAGFGAAIKGIFEEVDFIQIAFVAGSPFSIVKLILWIIVIIVTGALLYHTDRQTKQRILDVDRVLGLSRE